jgi:PAS domain S-box-containing protein
MAGYPIGGSAGDLMAPARTSPQHVKVLLLDTSPERAGRTATELKQTDRTFFEITWTATLEQCLEKCKLETYDVLLVDAGDQKSQATESLSAFRRMVPSLPMFVIADFEDPALAIEVLREGAEDCFVRRFVNPRALERALLYGTERRRGQCAMQERDSRYRALFNQIALGIALLEFVRDGRGAATDCRFLEVNRVFEKYTALDARDVLGKTLHEVFPEARSFWHRATEALAADLRPTQFEVYDPQTERWLDVTGFRLDGSQWAVTFADVTTRKRAEEDLLFKTALLEAQSETGIDGILVVDDYDRVVLANRRLAQLFGLPDGLLGTRDDRLLLEHVIKQISDPERFVQKVQYLYSHRDEKSIDEIRLTGERTFERYSAPLVDANGVYRGRIWYFHDVTHRKRTEEDLYRSRLMLQSILDNIPQRVFWKDRNSIYLGCNRAFAADAGLKSPDEIAGKTDFDLPWPETAEIDRADDRKVMDARTARLSFEETQNQPDGSLSWVRASKLPLRDREGNVTGVIVTYEDVTERKQLEIELRQAQKLEAVGQLAAGIAHEINTPIQFVGDNTRFFRNSFDSLAKLISSYDKLREVAAGKVEAESLEDVAAARDEADWDYLKTEVPKAIEQTLDGVDRVARIVRAMKEFSHVDRSGKKAAADLNRALESTLVVARNELKYVADVVTEFGNIPLVMCQLGDLNQVFLNLFVNAAHAIEDVVRGTGRKGTIRVRTWEEKDHVVVSVSDTGTGIPEAVRQKIFAPFFTTKEVGKGTGQGLALARSVIDRHSGSLTFETEVEKGTTFFVRLPVSPPETPGPKGEPA